MRKKRIFCLMLDEFQIQALSKYSNGIGRLACFEHLLLHAERQNTVHTKRGISYTVSKGCLDISEEELSVQWQCNRTTVHRMLKEWQGLGLITMKANNVTTIVSVTCLQSWYVGRDEGSFAKNDVFRYPNLMTDQPLEDFVPVRKQKPTATSKKTSSKGKASKASQSGATDGEANDADGTEEATDSVATSASVSLSSDDGSYGQDQGVTTSHKDANAQVVGVPVENNGQDFQEDISNDNAHTLEGASTDSVHETSDVNPKPQDKSDDDNSGTDKAQQNQRPQTESSV